MTAAGEQRRADRPSVAHWRLRFASQVSWYAVLITAILLTAFGLRVYDLERNPPELLNDELAGVISAWVVVTTGHDVEQTHLPFFPTRLEMKQPIYYLATVIPQALLGRQSILAARLPAVVFGLLSTIVILWFMRVLARSRAEALVAAALFAIVPWAVHYGRIGWEPAAVIAPTTAGLGALWLGIERQRTALITAGVVVLACGAYTYHPALLMNLLLAAAAIALHLPRLRRPAYTALLLGSVIALLLLVPYANAFLNEPVFTMRTKNVSVFSNGVTPEAIGVAWVNYWQRWNPQWLFLTHPADLRYHPNVPLLFAWMVPFLILGILLLLRSLNRANQFLLLWLILGPLPAGLTNNSVPHFARGLLALPPVLMITALGVVAVARYVWCTSAERRRPLALGLGVLVASVIVFQGYAAYHSYFTEYPRAMAPTWHYSSAPALRLARDVMPTGGTLCIEGNNGVDYWSFWHHIAYYLDGHDIEVVEGLSSPRCTQPGTYILLGLLYGPPPSVAAPTRLVARLPAHDPRPLFEFVEVIK